MRITSKGQVTIPLAIRGRLRRMSKTLGLPEPLEVHVGVESGEAAAGMGPAGQLLVTGPVVNAAARLQAAALLVEAVRDRGPFDDVVGRDAVGVERRVVEPKVVDVVPHAHRPGRLGIPVAVRHPDLDVTLRGKGRIDVHEAMVSGQATIRSSESGRWRVARLCACASSDRSTSTHRSSASGTC